MDSSQRCLVNANLIIEMDTIKNRVAGAAVSFSTWVDILFHTGDSDHIGLTMLFSSFACQDTFIYYVKDGTLISLRDVLGGGLFFSRTSTTLIYLIFFTLVFCSPFSPAVSDHYHSISLSLSLQPFIPFFFFYHRKNDRVKF